MAATLQRCQANSRSINPRPRQARVGAGRRHERWPHRRPRPTSITSVTSRSVMPTVCRQDGFWRTGRADVAACRRPSSLTLGRRGHEGHRGRAFLSVRNGLFPAHRASVKRDVCQSRFFTPPATKTAVGRAPCETGGRRPRRGRGAIRRGPRGSPCRWPRRSGCRRSRACIDGVARDAS